MARHTHTVTQTAPDGTTTEAKLYDVTDADAQRYCADVKADNPDYGYSWARVPLKLTTYGQALVDSAKGRA